MLNHSFRRPADTHGIPQRAIARRAVLLAALIGMLAALSPPARAAAPFAFNAIWVTPNKATPGLPVMLGVKITSTIDATNYPVVFSVGPTGSRAIATSSFLVTFKAGVQLAKMIKWTVPADAAAGSYGFTAAVYDPGWHSPPEAHAATVFTVGATSTNGSCGSANGGDFTSIPTANLCSAGAASAVSGNGAPWSWTCAGTGTGSTASCAAYLEVNGLVGPDKGQDFASLSAASAGLCAAGTVAAFTSHAAGWTWSCAGLRGGTTDASGVAYLTINGACGPANGIPSAAAPTTGLCSIGTASAVSATSPWDWSCAGSNGGTTAQCSAPSSQSGAPEVPGPSAALSAAPPYNCVTNVYVDGVNGNDANPGTQSQPWKTIQNANNGYPNTPVPGECVNVLPGTYTIDQGLVFSNGGNSNTATGYVVYRSTVPQAAHIIANFASGDMISVWVPYIIIDGFEIDGNHAATTGHAIDGCTCGGSNCNIAHHLTAINNVIHDVGGAGLNSCTADYITWAHNTVYNTSTTNQFETSGLSVWQPKALAPGSYTPTPADNVTYGIVIAYNIAHDNTEGNNGRSPHTDGNGIIIDTTFGSASCQTCGTPYPGKILVLGNLAYRNGGGGVHIFLSENVTVANNTAYDNYRDPNNNGTARGELSNGGSANVTWLNNIGYAIPGSGSLAYNAPVVTWSVGGNFPDSGSFTDTITYGAPVSTGPNESINPATNLLGVDPKLASPSTGNFTLLPGSPAIGAGHPETYLPVDPPDIGAY